MIGGPTQLELDDNNPTIDKTANPAWLLIFTDMISLILTFFVLLFSMGDVKDPSWYEEMTESFAQSMNPTHQRTVLTSATPSPKKKQFLAEAVDLDYLQSVLTEKLSEDPILAQSFITRRKDRLIISLPARFLFRPGSAQLTPESLRAALKLGNAFRTVGNQIDLIGHTDPSRPSRRGPFPTNWELSTARAMAVARAMADGGYRKDVSAYGAGASHFYLIPSDVPRTRKVQLARRVDVIVREQQAGSF